MPLCAPSLCDDHVNWSACSVLGAGTDDATATSRAAPLVTKALLRVGVRGIRALACW
jgi:hypothetical protein